MKQRYIALFCMFFGITSVFSQNPPGEPSAGKAPDMPPMGMMRGMHSSVENPQPMMMNIAELQTLLNDISIEKSVAAKITSIARGFLSTFESKILKIQREELNIKEELLKEKPDLAVIQNAINKKSQVFAEIEYAQIKRDLEIKAMLTQDEYDRWKSAMMQKMRSMMPKVMDRHDQNPQDKKAVRPK